MMERRDAEHARARVCVRERERAERQPAKDPVKLIEINSFDEMIYSITSLLDAYDFRTSIHKLV